MRIEPLSGVVTKSDLFLSRSRCRCFLENAPQLDFEDLGHAQQCIERRISQIPLDEADHSLRQPCTFGKPGHGNPLALPLIPQQPDDSPYLNGMGAFQKLQRQQAEWLKGIVKEPWFREAPHKVLFCHIPLWFSHPKIPNNAFDGTLDLLCSCKPGRKGA